MSLTDAQWARIEPLLPDRAPRRGGRWRDHRQVIDAIAFKYRTGKPWMDLPEHFGSWKGAHNRRQKWAADGTWEKVFTALLAQADAEGDLDRVVTVDPCPHRPRARHHGSAPALPAPLHSQRGSRSSCLQAFATHQDSRVDQTYGCATFVTTCTRRTRGPQRQAPGTAEGRPGTPTGILDYEHVIRMAPALRKACDVAERATLFAELLAATHHSAVHVEMRVLRSG
ncbi:transposase [Streptomyces sp. NPDC017993]|uniref:transposase n=1 Tax=Streptomyces sp. NPDC017993 TaxID=3365027 RepID=UPI00378752EC